MVLVVSKIDPITKDGPGIAGVFEDAPVQALLNKSLLILLRVSRLMPK